MSDGPVKSEFADRIDRLTDLIEAEREVQAACGRFESAQWEVVKAAEALKEWAAQWKRSRARAGLSDVLTPEHITFYGQGDRYTEASEVLRRFCDDAARKNATIAALEPAPAEQAPVQPPSAELRSVPGAEEEVRDQYDALAVFMQLPGAVKWVPGAASKPADDTVVEVLFEKGQIQTGTVADWRQEVSDERGFIIAYRPISQPADQSDEINEPGRVQMAEWRATVTWPDESDSETHTDDLRTAEGEEEADRKEADAFWDGQLKEREPVSILDDPDFQARVEAAREQEAAYVPAKDPELDAEYEAMRERETADRKLHFSIFGKREEV